MHINIWSFSGRSQHTLEAGFFETEAGAIEEIEDGYPNGTPLFTIEIDGLTPKVLFWDGEAFFPAENIVRTGERAA